MINKLAIIVPVYNVEKYIDECVSSILKQSYRDLTVILVDDGSTDSSGRKCDQWAKKNKHIRVFHKPNGGLMSAWKYGVTHSESEYIGFVDSDDWIETDMYEVLMDTAEKEDADIVISGLLFDYEGTNRTLPEKFQLTAGLYERTDIEKKIYPILISGTDYTARGLSPNRVTKIFRRCLLEASLSDCSDEVSIGEDLLTTFCCIQKANRVFVKADFYPYHYRINPNSMMQKYSDSKYEKINILYQHMLDVNKRSAYDFSKQIHTDYLKLTLMQLDTEILFSGRTAKELIARMNALHHDSIFEDAWKKSEWCSLPIKYKIYLNFFKHNLYTLVLAIRRIKQV